MDHVKNPNPHTRTFKYDGENRCTNILVTNLWRTDFRYDGLGRKGIRRDYNWVGGAWNRTNETRYIYDGLLLLQERNSNNVPQVTYTRGVDFSGSVDGAGGIGGLLGMTKHAQTSNYTHYFYHSDGMGNITVLQDTQQVVQAQYAYDPWGNLFSMSGPLTNLNRMRMAGKEWHPQTGLIDFGARFYNPTWQRWMNQDPIGVNGGLNVFTYVRNSPFNDFDAYGLAGFNEIEMEPEGEITREMLEELHYGRMQQEMIERYWLAEEYDREMSERIPGHRRGASYIGPPSPPPPSGPMRQVPCPPSTTLSKGELDQLNETQPIAWQMPPIRLAP